MPGERCDDPLCEHCGQRFATCVGAYEDSEPAYACDECCGHGCEDGWCEPVGDEDRRAAAPMEGAEG